MTNFHKVSRKGKNPGPADAWLDSLGFYRKNVAYDETCLFRSVSEQLYSSQIFHERIRKECINHCKNNIDDYLFLFEKIEDLDDHLWKLTTHMAICGRVELYIISDYYKCNIILFDSTYCSVDHFIEKGYKKTIMLCVMSEDHYDAVYPKEFISDAGFCQSIIYETLYERVFSINQVSAIVQCMLYNKVDDLFLLKTTEDNIEIAEDDNNNLIEREEKRLAFAEQTNIVDELQVLVQTGIAPFPYKVAKALDPNIYRNIEYDSWTETRKELRLGEWYKGDNNLILGTRCLLEESGSKLECYIQDILKETGECVVYITKLAEKRTVRYCELAPESDAKPWPLPYRFSKNVVPFVILNPIDKDRKLVKKRKDKKRTLSKSNENPDACTTDISLVDPVNIYEGCPLHMQEVGLENTKPGKRDQHFEQSNEPAHWDEQWDQPAVAWVPTSTPQNVFTFAPKTTEGSFAETPYYYDSSNSGQYIQANQAAMPLNPAVIPQNQGVLPVVSQNSVMTQNPVMVQNPVMAQNPVIAQNQAVMSQNQTVMSQNPAGMPQNQGVALPSPKLDSVDYNYSYCQTDGNYQSVMSPTAYTITTPPVFPPMGVYHSPVYSQPTTPILYTSPDAPEVMSPYVQPMTMFTPPPLDFYSPSAYCMIPPTPPSAWYPSNVNTHGFIFPMPVQNMHNQI